jgi:hypothetical protein
MAMTNKHVVKMIVESAQLLSTAHHVLDGGGLDIYKPTHANHPSAVWTRETLGNYLWLSRHLYFLLDEYGKRFNKAPTDHATYKVFETLRRPPKRIQMTMTTTPIKLAITDTKHIVAGKPIQSYRNYYVAEKLKTEEDKIRYFKVLDK